MKFGKYLKKRYNEDLAPNQVEIVGTQDNGINAQGSIGGTNIQQLIQQFMNKLPADKKNGPNIKAMFITWLQKNHPDVWQTIESKGGFDKLLGNKFPPADIIISGTDTKKGIEINPDK